MVCKKDLYINAKKICLCTEAIIDKQLCEDELTASQCYLLYYIWTCHPKGTFITSLHQELGLSMATISGCMKRLRQKGYIAVETCTTDERQRRLVPTDKLAIISENLETAIKTTENFVYGKLSKQEREQLLRLEEKVLKGVLERMDGENL